MVHCTVVRKAIILATIPRHLFFWNRKFSPSVPRFGNLSCFPFFRDRSCRHLSIRRFVSSNSRQSRSRYSTPRVEDMKRSSAGRDFHSKKRKQEQEEIFEGTHEQILRYEVAELLNSVEETLHRGSKTSGSDLELPEKLLELDLTVLKLSATGDALAVSDDYTDHIFVVPFCVPGDKVKAKVVRTDIAERYSSTDFIKILESSKDRHDDLVGCKYFSQCSGCQLQMMTYEDQLKHKRSIVEQAYRAFSGINPKVVPQVLNTLPSPMQYGYRTKLTPHFDGNERERVGGVKKFVRPPVLGYTMKGRKRVMEIEDCPIGTETVRKGLLRERQSLSQTYDTFKNGATILLRESTTRVPKFNGTSTTNGTASVRVPSTEADVKIPSTRDEPIIRTPGSMYTIEKRCISDMNGIATEYIDDYRFESRAGSFFQNNNSILSSFTEYIREVALPSLPRTTADGSEVPTSGRDDVVSSDPGTVNAKSADTSQVKYLLDAYCGSGLFTITLSKVFTTSLGVDVDSAAIRYARTNATDLNSVPNAAFLSADATALFKDVPFPPGQTVVVIDPPRKGCSKEFLDQLLKFGPKRVIYVSCNVMTQARDVGLLSRGSASGFGRVRTWQEWAEEDVSKHDMENEDSDVRWLYEIESLRGCDFFPQTGHVEGVAVLNRVERTS